MIMSCIMDKADLQFFEKRINALKLESIYTERIQLMITSALENYDKMSASLELQHSLFYCLWMEISKLCGMFFSREDDFFDTLRAMECEFIGRTFMVKVKLGWILESATIPKYVDDFLLIKFD